MRNRKARQREKGGKRGEKEEMKEEKAYFRESHTVVPCGGPSTYAFPEEKCNAPHLPSEMQGESSPGP